MVIFHSYFDITRGYGIPLGFSEPRMTNKTAIPYGFRCPGRFAIGNILKNLQQIHVQYIHHKWKITINGDLTAINGIISDSTTINGDLTVNGSNFRGG